MKHMKHLLLYIVLLLFVIPTVFANLDLTAVKVYVNNERETDADEDGGDIEVNQKDTMEVNVEVENTENTTTQVMIKGEIENIDDGDDLKKEQAWFDVLTNDDKGKSISFVIPDDAREDEYDFNLVVDYKYNNGTTGNYEIEYTVIVESIGAQTEEINLEDSFGNLTATCGSIVGQMGNYFGYVDKYTNCKDELSTVQNTVGDTDQDFQDCKGNLAKCETERAEYKSQKDNCDSSKAAMITQAQCDTKSQETVTAEVAKVKKDNSGLMTIVIVGGIAIFAWKKFGKKKHIDEVYEHDVGNF